MSGSNAESLDTLRIQQSRIVRFFRLRLLAIWLPAPLVLGVSSTAILYRQLLHPLVWVWYVFTGLVVLVCVGIPPMQAAALRYWLEGTTLRIDEGVLVRQRKSIPLDRITDLTLVQGPLLRLCGIWTLEIQTAGSAQQLPEGKLYGLVDPQAVRDTIMAVRDKVSRQGSTAS